jgi:hypothetical protein
MNKFYYYLILVALFLTLWAVFVTLFVIMEEFGYKAGSVLYYIAFFIIFGVIGAIKPYLKKKFKI